MLLELLSTELSESRTPSALCTTPPSAGMSSTVRITEDRLLAIRISVTSRRPLRATVLVDTVYFSPLSATISLTSSSSRTDDVRLPSNTCPSRTSSSARVPSVVEPTAASLGAIIVFDPGFSSAAFAAALPLMAVKNCVDGTTSLRITSASITDTAGLNVGASVGSDVGAAVGAPLGDSVGEDVGERVGNGVGD